MRTAKNKFKSFLILSVAFYMAFFMTGISKAYALTTNDVQSILNGTSFYDPNDTGTCSSGSGTASTILSGADNKAKIYTFLTQNNFTPIQAAGIMGNMKHESSYSPLALEGNPPIQTQTPPRIKKGYGIVQFTPTDKIINYAESVNKPVYELATQLEFFLKQLNGELTGAAAGNNETQAGKDVRSTTTIEDATRAFQGDNKIGGRFFGYERPFDQAGSLADRIATAKNILASYGGGSTSPAVSGDVPTSAASACACSAGNTDVVTNTANNIVVLDPGHSPKQSQPSIDTATNIVTSDSDNHPEMEQMFTAAQAISTKLTAAGYKVILTKNAVNDYVDLKERAEIGNRAKANVGISLHTTPGTPVSSNALYYPKVGEYRFTADGAKSAPYNNAQLAATDASYAKTMAEARIAAEGNPVKYGSYGDLVGMRSLKDAPPLMQKGNVLTTDYFAKVPWIYSEIAQDAGSNGVSVAGLQAYVNGIVTGVEKILPLTSGVLDAATNPVAAVQTGCGGGAVSGSLMQTILNYSWPDFHDVPYTTYKPAYLAAIKRAQARIKVDIYSDYVGGGIYPGIDCGGFVTRIMRDSGTDPNYNWGPGDKREQPGGTGQQKKYMDANPQKYENLGQKRASEFSTLKPGDIAINDSHTYIYVGKLPGFNGNSASASYSSWRTPMASNAYDNYADGKPFTWYRLK